MIDTTVDEFRANVTLDFALNFTQNFLTKLELNFEETKLQTKTYFQSLLKIFVRFQYYIKIKGKNQSVSQ